MIRIIVFLIAFNLSFNANAQNKIHNIEKNIQSFTANLYVNQDTAYYYIKKAYQESLLLKNDSLIAKSAFNFGLYYYLNNDYNKSKNYLNTSIPLANKTKLHLVLASSFNILGLINVFENKDPEALKLYLKSFDIADKNNLYECKSKVLNNIGSFYLIQKDTLKSLNYFNQSIINSEKNGLQKQLAQAYTNSAILYTEKNKPKAIQLYNKALKIAEKDENLTLQLQLHINLSNLYLNEKSKIEQAFYHLQQAEKLQNNLDDQSKSFYVDFNYGAYFFEKNKNNEALKYYNKALNQTTDIPSDRILALYKAIAEANTANKNYKTALEYNEKHNALADSIFTIEKNKSFNEIQTKYEVDKKNLKIDILSKEKTIEKNKRQTTILIGILIIGIIILFFRNRIKTQKILEEKEKEKLKQEQEVKRVLGIIEGQDKERNRLATEIHDGVGGELAGIKLKLSKLNKGINNENIDGVINQIGNVFKNLRDISHNLSSNYIKGKDLKQLLLDLQQDYKSRAEFEVELIVFPEKCLLNLPENTKLQLYRIIQELLNNVSKYAKASNVYINITEHENVLNIIFEDDGIGFHNKEAKGIGLKNIEERLLGIDGSINIESNIGSGTTIMMEILR